MQDYRASLTERQLKRQVEDYLLTLEAQGKLWFERLNAGNILAVQGEAKPDSALCREGTADFIVVQYCNFYEGDLCKGGK